MKFSDIKLSDIGQEVQLVGAVWAGKDRAYVFYFPEYGHEFDLSEVEMSNDDWQALLRQSDFVETEMFARAPNGDLVKVIARKCERNISQQVSWNVFRRDRFACRYCGADAVPLTVDHLVLWEDNGPSIESNLVAACRKCNKTRGRMPYEEWLKTGYYQVVSQRLTDDVRAANARLIGTLAEIPRRYNTRSR